MKIDLELVNNFYEAIRARKTLTRGQLKDLILYEKELKILSGIDTRESQGAKSVRYLHDKLLKRLETERNKFAIRNS